MRFKRVSISTINTTTHPHLKHVLKEGFVDDVYDVLYDKVGKHRHLRIMRLDGEPIHNYMDMQEIKNVLWGAEVVAIQVFPRQSTFRDGSNTYHLWTWEGIETPNLAELYEYID